MSRALDWICTHRFNGLEKPDTVFLNVTVSISKFDESFAGCCLWLSHADNRKDVPECWKGRLDERTSIFDMAANKSIGLIIYLCETERARRKLAAASLCAPSALQDKQSIGMKRCYMLGNWRQFPSM